MKTKIEKFYLCRDKNSKVCYLWDNPSIWVDTLHAWTPLSNTHILNRFKVHVFTEITNIKIKGGESLELKRTSLKNGCKIEVVRIIKG